MKGLGVVRGPNVHTACVDTGTTQTKPRGMNEIWRKHTALGWSVW